MREQQPDEATSLLVRELPPSPSQNRRSGILYAASAGAAVLLITIGNQITVTPLIDILEGLVCREYHAGVRIGTPPVDDRCKIEPVQSEVALILGWSQVFGTLPAVLLAIPYGKLADRIGRKKVFILAIFGCFMSDAWIRLVYWFPGLFPLRAVWLAGLWLVIGAGPVTISSLVFAMVADLCSPEQRIMVFALIHGASLVSEVVFIPLGALFASPWTPMFISLALTMASLCCAVLFIPETLSTEAAHAGDEGPDQGSVTRNKSPTSIQLRPHQRMVSLLRCRLWVANNARVVLVMLSFLLFHLGEAAGSAVLLQYASKRLHWSLAKASLLLSLRAGISLAATVLLIPALSRYFLRSRHLHEVASDKRIAQISGVLLATGSAIVFIAKDAAPLVTGQVLLSLGWSFPVPARSLVSNMVAQNELATVYTAIAVLVYGGGILGAPVMAGVFQWGMRQGQFWMGAPFFVAGAAFALAVLSITAVAARGQEPREAETEAESGPEPER